MSKVYFDVGAHEGGNYTGYDRVFLFEPNPAFYNILKDRERDDRIKFFNFAVDVIEGERDFNIAPYGASSLWTFTNNSCWKNRDDVIPHSVIKVNTVRLDTIVNTHSVDQINFLEIDAQGNDLRVMESLGAYINIVREGVIEAARCEETKLYDRSPTQQEVCDFLTSNGFKIVAISSNDTENAEVNIRFKR